jgi:mannan endo-1,4-beta-mannosidase
MKTKIGIAVAAVVAIAASFVVAIAPAHAAVGIRISGGRLVEGNGQALVLRGVNAAHTWFTSQTAASFEAIKAAGANSVRVVLSGGRWQPANNAADVANVVNLCKQNRLICVLENHDTTGFNEQQGAVSLDASVTYWISLQSALTGQENYVIINLGNEPFGNGSSPASSTWPTATANAIRRMRTAGFEHTLMVDAPNWGQDWQNVMRDNAATVYAADTTGNTIFSVHMYGVYTNATIINSYLDSFVSRGLPLVVGEFGHNHSDGNPDEDAIMAGTQQRNLGYLGWSWSGNSGGVEYLDMVQNVNNVFQHNQRTAWGTRFITGANGLQATSREACVYSGCGPTTGPQVPGVPGTPTVTGVTQTSVSLSWTPSSGTVTNYQIERATGATSTTFTAAGTSTTTSFTDTGRTANTTYRYRVRATNTAGNSAFSGIVNATTSGQTTQPPGTPGPITFTGTTSTGVTVNWGASTGTVTNYQVERATGATSTTFTQVGTATTTSFTNTGLTPNTTYRYRVRANNSAGTSAYTAIANVTTGVTVSPPVTTTPPPPVGGCTATYAQQGSNWPGGFQGGVTVTNTGTNATSNWTVTLTFSAGQRITQIWNGATNTSGNSPYSITAVDHNRVVQPGQTATFGFLGSWNNSSNPTPTVSCSRTP